jgi:outer membrane protein OmpA-like peptidoglycan-associated protein
MRLLPLVPLALLGFAPIPAGAEDAALRLFHGPDDSGTMNLKALRVVLDGKDVGVTFTPGKSAESPFYVATVAPGVHRVEFEASLDRPSRVFTYMDGYRVTLRSALDVEVPASKGLAIRSRIVPRGGLTTQWHDENGMVLTLTASEGPPAPAPAVAAEAEHPAPAPAAASAAVVASDGPEAGAVAAVGAGKPGAEARIAQAPAEDAAPGPAPSGARECTLAPVQFAFAAAALSDAARRSLAGFAGCAAAGRSSLLIVGHTDSRGTDEFNRKLGERRAAAVSAFLEAHGVGSPRITMRSSGASQPLCDESSERCWARNRRVEVTTGR